MRKVIRRAAVILQNSLHNLLLPAVSILLASLVIRLTSKELWGGFVDVLVAVQFTAQIAAWGNKEYLLRGFSRQPGAIPHQWQVAFYPRLLIALPFILLSRDLMPFVWLIGSVIAASFDVLILYRKAFLYAITIELTAALGIAIAIITRQQTLTVDDLVAFFAIATWLKVILLIWRFRDVLGFTWGGFAYFSAAFPFFLLTFSGALASRIDLYTVSLLRPHAEVAQYQVFINLMLYLQALSNFILLPYTKNVYRLNDSSIEKLARRLFSLGVLIVPPAILAAWGLLWLLYDIRFSASMMLLGGAFVLPIYAFLPLIYRLYKRDEQNTVLWINIYGAAANLILNLIFLPILGIAGAILASAIIQWGMLYAYLSNLRRANRHAE